MSLSISRDISTHAAMDDVQILLKHWFGTPDEPRWPESLMTSTHAKQLVSTERLVRAAGAVTSDRDDMHTGLYQEHCNVCHGISGSGAGAAAQFQSPYPRDFRAGIFKWKSTPRSEKPSRDDLLQLLHEGVSGSAMPSFALVLQEDREALVDYLIYLSVRGEVERAWLAAAIDELDYDEAPPTMDLRLVSATKSQDHPEDDGAAIAIEILQDVVNSWVDATPSPVPPDPIGSSDLLASVQRGRELFHSQIANCAACHGAGGQGGVAITDYDEWTKEFTTRIGITPDDRDAIKPFRRAGALPPRQINPRMLTGGSLRGGSDSETLFRRIQHGIAGTPMPGVGLKTDADDQFGFTASDIWDLVHYVQSILSSNTPPTES
ncbi:MAG: cytochrome c [Planctomycetota bacterium]